MEFVDADGASLSEEEDPMVDLVNDHVVVNIGVINKSADPPLEESIDNDLEDARPDTYKDRLKTYRARIAAMIGEEVERTAGPRRKPHSKVTWEVVENHTAHNEPEVAKVRKEHISKVGYKDIDALLREEKCQDPVSASGDGTSYSQTPLRPTDTSKCTIFANMRLNLSFVNWHRSFEDLNKCVENTTSIKQRRYMYLVRLFF